MRGQSSAEMLILVAAILIAATSTLYLGMNSNESTVVMRAARDGAENAIIAIDSDYGCAIDIEGLTSSVGIITIQVTVRNTPPSTAWDNFRENVIKKTTREGALRYINNALFGSFPATAGPVKTAYYTYDVTVEVRRVTK